MKCNIWTLVRSVGKKEISLSADLDVDKVRSTQVMLVEEFKKQRDQVLLTSLDLLDPAMPEVTMNFLVMKANKFKFLFKPV